MPISKRWEHNQEDCSMFKVVASTSSHIQFLLNIFYKLLNVSKLTNFTHKLDIPQRFEWLKFKNFVYLILLSFK